MKTINLCGRPGGCCPILTVCSAGKKKIFTILDDYGNEVQLTENEAKTLAREITDEIFLVKKK